MNLVVITAALSSANTNLYLSSRMLYSLARGHYAPAALGRVSLNGVPHRALAVSSMGMVVAILLAVYIPQRAFLLMYGSAVAGMYFVWIVILLAHLKFRQSIGSRVNDLPLKLRWFPFSNLAGIAVLLAIAGSTFYIQGLQYSVPTFVVLLVIMTLAYWKVRPELEAEIAARLEAESSPAES
jgi:L-asparagine transporter-like permease